LIGLKCGIGAIICSPVGAVIGAVAGGVTVGQKVAASDNGGHVGRNAGAPPREFPKTDMDRFNAHHALAGRFKGHGPLQSGFMFVDTSSIADTTDGQKKNAYLVVNAPDNDLSNGAITAWSYRMRAEVHCPTRYFVIDGLMNYPRRNAQGRGLGWEDISPPLLIEDNIYNPDNALRTAADIVCKS
jgi:hypothetical protein